MNSYFEVLSKLAFGTSFRPNKRRNKLKKYKQHKRTKLEISELHRDEAVKNKRNSYEMSDTSDSEQEKESPKKRKKEKKRLSMMHKFKIRQEEVRHLRRVNKIYVEGSDIPDPLENFEQLIADFDVAPCILENIQKLGYAAPTPIQMQALPLLLHNRQILACAPTGSGKTAAFLIPVINNLRGLEKEGLRAVIIAPTRELAKQIHSFAVSLSEGSELRTVIIEDVNAAKEKPNFFEKYDILISTPNRLIYMLKNDPPLISLSKVQWLIVDECDKLFEEGKNGFRDQLAVIYNACDSAELKRAMFSATFSYDVEQWCKVSFDSLVSVSIGTRNTAVETVKQELFFVGSEGGKLLALKNLIKEGFAPPMMIFVQSKERAHELFSEFLYDNLKISVIHSDLKQNERDSVVQNFIIGKIWILICTELMGRGMDFKGVNLVVNYDFPLSAISYIHRIGRTGRAGKEGKAITYFTNDDLPNLRSIAQVMKNAGCEVPEYIMKLKKQPKKNKGKIEYPIKRENISNVSSYQLQKGVRNRKMIQNPIRKKFQKKKKNQTSQKQN